MTIIEPNKEKMRLSASLLILLLLSAVSVGLSIYLYQETVSLRHFVSENQRAFEEAEARNAELRESLYAILNPENLSRAAAERGLIPAARPKYLEVGEQVLAAGL